MHSHTHIHNIELGGAIGIVPSHEEENSNIGIHLHFIKGFGELNNFGLGLSLETILDDHKHNSISIIGTYHFKSGITIGYAPGILFVEHEGESEIKFTQHIECYYEFELDKLHLGPQFDIGYENNNIHFMIGIHLGIDL